MSNMVFMGVILNAAKDLVLQGILRYRSARASAQRVAQNDGLWVNVYER